MIPGKTIIGGSSAEHARHASDFYETPDEYERLRFADRLDAYMWAKHHAPHVLDGDNCQGILDSSNRRPLIMLSK